jgi:hypothetical protein
MRRKKMRTRKTRITVHQRLHQSHAEEVVEDDRARAYRATILQNQATAANQVLPCAGEEDGHQGQVLAEEEEVSEVDGKVKHRKLHASSSTRKVISWTSLMMKRKSTTIRRAMIRSIVLVTSRAAASIE